MTSLDFYDIQVGIIEKGKYASGIIYQEEFAPGIWAGVRDYDIIVKRDNKEFLLTVTFCDLENRTIYHKIDENGPYLQTGDKLYFKKFRIENGI